MIAEDADRGTRARHGLVLRLSTGTSLIAFRAFPVTEGSPDLQAGDQGG